MANVWIGPDPKSGIDSDFADQGWGGRSPAAIAANFQKFASQISQRAARLLTDREVAKRGSNTESAGFSAQHARDMIS
jgi:hypothetical protein